jgi:hypothetical protein
MNIDGSSTLETEQARLGVLLFAMNNVLNLLQPHPDDLYPTLVA